MKNLFIASFLTFLFCTSAFAQREINGRVVEIIDGRTVVVEVGPNNKVTAQLQFIEVPEADQPLYQTVKDHLQQMLLGQKIALKPQRLIQTQTIAQIFVGSVDASQQMIRDGAAWYAVEQKSAQEPLQSEIYQKTEAQAKLEKLGVWSIADLKPSWQIRAERAEFEKQQEILARQKAEKEYAEAAKKAETIAAAKPKPIVRQQLNSESQLWAGSAQGFGKLSENVQNIGGLLVGYNAEAKSGFAATPLLKIEVADKDGRQAVGVGIAYLYRDTDFKGRETKYLVGVESESRDFRFLKYNDLTITADNQKIVVGKAIRFTKKDVASVKEMLFYDIKRSVFVKVANAKNVQLKVGTYSGKLPENIQAMLLNMLKVSE